MSTGSSDDDRIEAMVWSLLERRSVASTICPSEVARALHRDEATWRAAMPRVRAVAARLARDGRLRVTRSGVEVDAEDAGGPIRLGRPRLGPP